MLKKLLLAKFFIEKKCVNCLYTGITNDITECYANQYNISNRQLKGRKVLSLYLGKTNLASCKHTGRPLYSLVCTYVVVY